VSVLENFHRAIELLPVLAKFALFMVLLISVPRLSRGVRLPEAVGLLLMFFAGLEINLRLFREEIFRSIVFGVATTSIPLLLGMLAAHLLGYGLLPSVVVGSLLASHTLLGASIVAKLGVNRLEPIVVTLAPQ
jgi:hypothetical protein